MKLSDDLAFRGLIHQVTDAAVLDRLDSGAVTVYAGFDPSGPSLHLGHLIPLFNLRRLQIAGNRPIALVGGGTGLIGDPTFKDEERPLLSVDEIEANLVTIRDQMGRFLDFSDDAGPARARLRNNADWLTSASLTDFLRDVGKHVTVNQMIAKESVRARLEREDVGLSFTEFSYMLLQAYDFLRLHQDEGCTLQLGGSDQWGNITVGAELVRKSVGATVYGLTTPLLVRPDGRKFGKSEAGNESVWLDPERTSPFAMYQFLRNSEDAMVGALLRYFTFLSHDEILELDERTAHDAARREAQRALAAHVVGLVHGEAAARQAERASDALFSEEISALDERTLLDAVADAPSSTWARTELEAGVDPVDLLVRTGLAQSRAEARRYLDQGGAYLNNVRLEPTATVDLSRALYGRYLVVRRGRRQLHLIVAS